MKSLLGVATFKSKAYNKAMKLKYDNYNNGFFMVVNGAGQGINTIKFALCVLSGGTGNNDAAGKIVLGYGATNAFIYTDGTYFYVAAGYHIYGLTSSTILEITDVDSIPSDATAITSA